MGQNGRLVKLGLKLMHVLVKVQVFKEIVFNKKKSALLLKIFCQKMGHVALFAF